MSYLPSNLPNSSATSYGDYLSTEPHTASGGNSPATNLLAGGVLDSNLGRKLDFATNTSNPDMNRRGTDIADWKNDFNGTASSVVQYWQRFVAQFQQWISPDTLRPDTLQTGTGASTNLNQDLTSFLDDDDDEGQDMLSSPVWAYALMAAARQQASVQPPAAASDPSTAGASTANTQLEPDATQPPNSISVKDFGAKGDGISDDQAAIQHAFDAAKTSGQTVWIPPGTYNHSGVLTVDGIKVAGAGEQTLMRATNPDQSAIRLTGANGMISDLTTQVSAPNRSSMPNAAAILVQNASNATVVGCVARGASSNGIRLDGATNCTIRDNLVMGTNADGIALMNGSCNNLIEHNVVYQAGDDAYSDDSYAGDARQDEGNVFRDDLAFGNSYGRGFALMGSRNDTIENCVSYDTPGNGIVAGTDGNSGTMTGYGHVIRNNLVLNSRDTPFAINGMTASGNTTSGAAPILSQWTRKTIIQRGAISSSYVPGTGPGANNTPGNRT